MKHTIILLLLLAAGVAVMAAPQDTRPPLSKDELHDLLFSATPSKVIVSTIEECGIAFEPTPRVLEEFRKAGADAAVLAVLREAWHADIPKPLGDKEIRMMLAQDVRSEDIISAVLQRGIDFLPTDDYLAEVQTEGASDALVNTLRTSVPRPFSKAEVIQQLHAHVEQDWLAENIQKRAIDFEPNPENLEALRNAGARAPLLETVRTAKRAKPFVAQNPPPPPVSQPLMPGKAVALVCTPSDKFVPVFAAPNDLGNVAASLPCGDHVTFMERLAFPPGIDRIKYGDGKEGFVSNSYLELPIATLIKGITAPKPIFKPEPGYTPEARHAGIEGMVELWIVVDAQGNVGDVRETSEVLGGGLDKMAIDTVKTWKFNPAMRGGVAVPVRVMVQVSFRLGSPP